MHRIATSGLSSYLTYEVLLHTFVLLACLNLSAYSTVSADQSGIVRSIREGLE